MTQFVKLSKCFIKHTCENPVIQKSNIWHFSWKGGLGKVNESPYGL